MVAVALGATACGDGAVGTTRSAGTATVTTRDAAGAVASAATGAPARLDLPLPDAGTAVLVAHATVPEVVVRDEPGDGTVVYELTNPTPNGGPLVFLVHAVDGEYLEVQLPVRPNGTRGWVRAADVQTYRDEYRVEVSLGTHRLRVLRAGEVVLDEPVGVGKEPTPTPLATHYVAELLEPADPGGPYGPFAFGLSGYSESLESYNGGAGVVGIHGTNDPSSVGRDVSHGCLRVTNDVITRLAAMLPLGTPVVIAE